MIEILDKSGWITNLQLRRSNQLVVAGLRVKTFRVFTADFSYEKLSNLLTFYRYIYNCKGRIDNTHSRLHDYAYWPQM